jgi:hypothetical protein
MSFVMHDRLRSWFGIQNQRPFNRAPGASRDQAERFLMFDCYYSCLLIGLDRRRQGRPDQLEPTDFTRAYPDDYKGQAELIAGLLVEAELSRQDIDPEDRESIESEMVRLLDLKSATRLSVEGDRLLNLYAAAGFEALEATIPAPDNVEDFLVAYNRIWATDG